MTQHAPTIGIHTMDADSAGCVIELYVGEDGNAALSANEY